MDTFIQSLTPRERQIMDLIADHGASNKEIARDLALAESTVKVVMRRILVAGRFKNRTHAALHYVSCRSQLEDPARVTGVHVHVPKLGSSIYFDIHPESPALHGVNIRISVDAGGRMTGSICG